MTQMPSGILLASLTALVWKIRPKWRDGGQPLRTTQYRLGLVCDKCHGCPTTTCEPSTAMAITIVAESLLLLSLSHLTNPSSKLRPLLRVKTEHSTQVSPEGRLDWLVEKSVSAKLPAHLFFHWVWQSSCLLQRVTIYCYLHKGFRVKVKHSQLKQLKLQWYG